MSLSNDSHNRHRYFRMISSSKTLTLRMVLIGHCVFILHCEARLDWITWLVRPTKTLSATLRTIACCIPARYCVYCGYILCILWVYGTYIAHILWIIPDFVSSVSKMSPDQRTTWSHSSTLGPSLLAPVVKLRYLKNNTLILTCSTEPIILKLY